MPFRILPSAAARLITRPAPWFTEHSDSSELPVPTKRKLAVPIDPGVIMGWPSSAKTVPAIRSGPKARVALLAEACAVLHLNTIPERFGLVMAESMAAGVPVVAMDLGSCREVIADGETGFLVNSVDEAVETLDRIDEIDRRKCRKRVEDNFTIDKMVEGYERVYEEIFRREAEKK